MLFEEIDKYIAENSGVWEKQTRDILLAMPEGLPNRRPHVTLLMQWRL